MGSKFEVADDFRNMSGGLPLLFLLPLVLGVVAGSGGEGDTVDGSEIPNNHLGCIKTCK